MKKKFFLITMIFLFFGSVFALSASNKQLDVSNFKNPIELKPIREAIPIQVSETKTDSIVLLGNNNILTVIHWNLAKKIWSELPENKKTQELKEQYSLLEKTRMFRHFAQYAKFRIQLLELQ